MKDLEELSMELSKLKEKFEQFGYLTEDDKANLFELVTDRKYLVHNQYRLWLGDGAKWYRDMCEAQKNTLNVMQISTDDVDTYSFFKNELDKINDVVLAYLIQGSNAG